MTKYVPFTAHVRVVPSRGNGKRFEYIRDLQKIATQVYDELDNDSDLTLAMPGGGQYQSFNGGGSAWGGLTNGMAVKPQIGEFPAQLMITGFYTSTDKNEQSYPNMSIIHTGSLHTGAGGSHAWDSNPNTDIDTYASTIKGKIETAVNTVLGATDWNVYKLDVSGVRYGAGGYHFP